MQEIRVMRRPEVERTVGLSRSTIYAAMDRGEFPRPIRLGRRSVGWMSSDILNWLENRSASNAYL